MSDMEWTNQCLVGNCRSQINAHAPKTRSFVLFFFCLFYWLKLLFSTEADSNLGIEDLLDEFLTFFIAGKKCYTWWI